MPTDHIIETNGTRPFQNRPRRPLIGDPFSKPQLEYLNRLEARIAALEARGTAPVISQAEQVQALQAHASRQPAPTLNQEDAPPADGSSPAGSPPEGFPGGNAAGFDAIAEALEKRKAEEARLATATPAMLGLINEAASPELRDKLITIAEEDKPAQVRLAAMRKANNTPPTP